MELATYIGVLILCLSQSIDIARADWRDPPLFAPDPMDEALKNFTYNPISERTRIVLLEEVDYEVCIAVINFEGTPGPIIGPLSDDKNIFVLGAELRPFPMENSINKWKLWITKKQDYETSMMREYRFSIIGGAKEYPITLTIENIDDNSPIVRAKERNCTIEENYEGLSNCNFVVSDADGWIDDVVTILTANQDDKQQNFQLITSKVTGANANFEKNLALKVAVSLDFETISMYMLLIRAMDGAKNEGSLSTVVEVIDMPDMPPIWTKLTAAENILEKSSKKFEVSAIDGDVQINAEINYRIQVNEDRDKNFFVVDSKTGIITINKIDRDELQKEVFRFMIIAYETLNLTSSINATIIVVVEDINDHSPVISPDLLTIEIEEEKYNTLEFNPAIKIIDPDLAENGQFSVSLVDSPKHNWSSAFLVVPTNGYQEGIFTISVVNASLLDYEDEDWREIDIQLRAVEKSNTSHVGTKNIHISLINWNDELPKFDNTTLSEVSIKEDVVIGTYIATVHATDRDVDDNVTHSLESQQSLTIDQKTGVVVTNRNDTFDYESMPVVVTQIVAHDQANHKTYATLTINVIDVNDEPPNLYLPNKNPTLVEEKDIGTEVKTSITARDVDTDAELHFTIDWDNTWALKSSIPVEENLYRGHLQIVTTWPKENKRYAEGTLVVSGRIDYEAFDVMYLALAVTDNKTVHNVPTTSASLTLNIIDINDNSPIFDPIEKMNVVENQIADAPIGTVTAKDRDGPQYNKVSYIIEPINGTEDGLIFINKTTGVIRVLKNKGIDAELYEYIYYNVNATDGERNTTEMISIYVIDQNDVIPSLLNDNFPSTITIREKSPNGTHIVKIDGEDKDRTYPFNNISYLINEEYSASMQYFSIGRFDGQVHVHLSEGYILDRDAGPTDFTVNLKLRDNYLDDHVTWNTNAIDTIVTVILQDINDQPPKLPEINATSVTENTNNGALVLSIRAEDKDDPNTDNTKVSYKILSISAMSYANVHLDEKCSALFAVKTRYQSVADIYTNCDLKGYYGSWKVELYAQDLGTDPGPLNDTRSYIIQVTDFNYNDPVIVFPTSKKIPLRVEQTLHAQLRTYDDQLLNDFKATDKDNGASGTVTFNLSSSSGDHEYFEIASINKNVVQLRLAKVVNVSSQSEYQMTLMATDGGNPSRRVIQEVTIIFISALGPEFTNNEWMIWIKENTIQLDAPIIIPKAHDMVGEADDNTVDIYYFFTNEDDSDMKYFALNKTTRNLTMKEELDREKQEIMTLNVVATTDKNGPPGNPLAKSVLKIIVVVLDENDNPPIFENKTYSGGVAMEDPHDNIVLTVKATDADINETLTYSIVKDSMSTSDSSLKEIQSPFSLDLYTGKLLLKFTATSNMKGFFKFDIAVHDKMDHEDKATVQVYIVAQKNRVVFTFNNTASYVEELRWFAIETFSSSFGYLCNIDDIKSTHDANDQVLDNVTTVTTHFIDSKDNLPINSETIIQLSSDLSTVSNLKATFLTRSLRLVDVPTGSSSAGVDIQETIHWILVTLTIFFCLCSVTLFVVFSIRTRRLSKRLEKLAITKYGSQESGLDKAGVVPTTNQFALAGSNPMWNTTKSQVDDNISQGSGDSDLIGVENNPDFGYVNGAFRLDDRWETPKGKSMNPAFAHPEIVSYRLDDQSEEDKDRGSLYINLRNQLSNA